METGGISPRIAAIILAAGKSTRMGTPKMVLPWGERSVLGQVIFILTTAGIHKIVVVTGGHQEVVAGEAGKYGAEPVFNPDFDRGEMLSSIQTGLRATARESQACLIALGDNPQIELSVVVAMLARFKQTDEKSKILLPSFQNRRGHPWIVHKSLWEEILSLKPPLTMRDFFTAHAGQIDYEVVNTESILKDLDTPQDYEMGLPRA